MATIEFNAAFRTDKAGRPANQDNGFCILDVKDQNSPVARNLNTDRTIRLGDYGALFVVADGMGGMNAGEKASELVVQGMRQAFTAVTAKEVSSPDAMAAFLTAAIVKADGAVKTFARENPSTRGMGSTIVALWICNNIAVTAWVGDSRIYRFNPGSGLVRLSHDHSYVQNLVDTGRLPESMAFDHPDSNIITRSLGDNGEPAKPEARIYKVYDLDEFLLCSDGLCGLLTDGEIETEMKNHVGSARETLDALWNNGAKKGFTDNCTIEIVCVTGELPASKGKKEGYPEIIPSVRHTAKMNVSENGMAPQVKMVQNRSSYRNVIMYLLIGLVVVCGGVACYYFMSDTKHHEEITEQDMDHFDDDDDGLSSEVKQLVTRYKDLNERIRSGNISSNMARDIQELNNQCSNLRNKNLSDKQREQVEEIQRNCQNLQGLIHSSQRYEIHQETTTARPAPTTNNRPSHTIGGNVTGNQSNPREPRNNVENPSTSQTSQPAQPTKPTKPTPQTPPSSENNPIGPSKPTKP